MRAVANGKISAFFFYKPLNVEKKHRFYLNSSALKKIGERGGENINLKK